MDFQLKKHLGYNFTQFRSCAFYQRDRRQAIGSNLIKYALAFLLFASFVPAAQADQHQTALQRYYEENIQPWASDPTLISAINAQNLETSGYDQSAIDLAELSWRAEIETGNTEVIDAVVSNPAAAFLRAQIAESDGAITEAFIMDAQGLNVAASTQTSDYWQGDEAKFNQTYPMGAGAVHLGDVQVDDSTLAVQAQVSFSMVDPGTGGVIGAMTVAVDLLHLLQ